MSEPSHSHVAQFTWATLGLLSFSAIEFAIGLLTHNPAMVADASHNLSDGVLTGLGAVVEVITSRAKSHAVSCVVPKVVGATVCILTIVFVGVFVATEASKLDPLLNPWLIVPVGLASFALNNFFGNQLHHEHNRHARAWSKHLKSDAWLSLGLIPGGLLTYRTGLVGFNIAAAILIWLFVAWHNGIEAVGTIRTLHREQQHEEAMQSQSEDDHDDPHGPDHPH